jgi:hypothetical protein
LDGNIYANGINGASWRRFLEGKKTIGGHAFVAYCQALDLSWENVVDPLSIDGSMPFILLPPSSSNDPQDASKFIRDVTIPDGTIMQPGEEFIKTWEICNSGNVPWQNRYLTRMGAYNAPALIFSPKRVKIPFTAPGSNVEISVKMKAPEVATTTSATWKMTYGSGELCFPERYKYGLAIIIHVIQ